MSKKKNKKPLTLKNAKSTRELVISTEVVSPVDGRAVEVKVAVEFPANRGVDAIDGLAQTLMSGDDIIASMADELGDKQAIEFIKERGL